MAGSVSGLAVLMNSLAIGANFSIVGPTLKQSNIFLSEIILNRGTEELFAGAPLIEFTSKCIKNLFLR